MASRNNLEEIVQQAGRSLQKIIASCDVAHLQVEYEVHMGSSLQVQPAASFPVLAKRNGAVLAIINREPTPLDEYADFVHHGAIGEFCGRFGEMIADG